MKSRGAGDNSARAEAAHWGSEYVHAWIVNGKSVSARQDYNWGCLSFIREYRSRPRHQTGHALLSLKDMAAIVVGHEMSPDRLRAINTTLHEYIQRWTPWWWQVGTFNPIRRWAADGELVGELHLAQDCRGAWVLHGPAMSVRSDGGRTESEYCMDAVCGRWRQYCSCGVLTDDVGYDGGALNGEIIRRNCDGDVTFSGHYDNGAQQGLARQWKYEIGTYTETYFRDGKRHGIARKYCIWSGALLAESHYHYIWGAHGLLKRWSTNGTLLKVSQRRRGKKHGFSVRFGYATSGERVRIAYVESWHHGSRTGSFTVSCPLIVSGPKRPDIVSPRHIPTDPAIDPPCTGEYVTDESWLDRYGLDDASIRGGFAAAGTPLAGEYVVSDSE